jgi:Aspartyl protease
MKIQINGKLALAILDTGCNASLIMSEALFNQLELTHRHSRKSSAGTAGGKASFKKNQEMLARSGTSQPYAYGCHNHGNGTRLHQKISMRYWPSLTEKDESRTRHKQTNDIVQITAER